MTIWQARARFHALFCCRTSQQPIERKFRHVAHDVVSFPVQAALTHWKCCQNHFLITKKKFDFFHFSLVNILENLKLIEKKLKVIYIYFGIIILNLQMISLSCLLSIIWKCYLIYMLKGKVIINRKQHCLAAASLFINCLCWLSRCCRAFRRIL